MTPSGLPDREQHHDTGHCVRGLSAVLCPPPIN